MMEHPDEITLTQFVTGQMSEEAEELLEEHLSVCEKCRLRLDEVERRANTDPFLNEIKQAVSQVQPTGPHVASKLRDLYQLEERIGSGGMGVVWKAHDKQANRTVVVKFIQSNVLRAKESMEFLHETFLKVHKFQHSNICPLYGLLDDPEYGPYLVMKYIEGQTLEMYRREHPFMTIGEVVEILRYVARALDYAHGYKVIHRDIKPQNIMIGNRANQTDNIQVIDFELADAIHDPTSSESIHVSSRVAGTCAYMAPEQWKGQCDIQTDQYALAVTAYELLSGNVPFTSKTLDELCQAVLDDPPAPIEGLSEEINAVLLKGLAKEPSNRYKSCSEFIKALANSGQVGGVPLSSSSFPEVPVVRHPKVFPNTAKSSKTTNSIITILLAGMVGSFILAVLSFLVFMIVYPNAIGHLIQNVPFASPSNTDQPSDTPEKSGKTAPVPVSSVPEPPGTNTTLPPGQPPNGYVPVPDQTSVTRAAFPRRTALFPTIRYHVKIDNNGIVTFLIASSNSLAPLPTFDGFQFNFNTPLSGGMGFRGLAPEFGRVVFPLGIMESEPVRTPDVPVVGNSGNFTLQKTDYGWTYRLAGHQWDSSRKLTRFTEGPNILSPGVLIGKEQKLPAILVFDIVDDPYCHPPHLEIKLQIQKDKNDIEKCVTISCTGTRKDAQTVAFSARISTMFPGGMSHPYDPANRANFNNAILRRGFSIDKNLVIPSRGSRDFSEKNLSNNAWQVSYRLNVHTGGFPSSINKGYFELAFFDMVGNFVPDIGIPRLDPMYPVPAAQLQTFLLKLFPHGSKDKVISVNGARDWSDICKSLNSLHFGEEVTLKVERGSNYRGPNKDVIIYAQ